MADEGDLAPEPGVALLEHLVYLVDLGADGVQDGLAVDRAGVEQHVYKTKVDRLVWQ